MPFTSDPFLQNGSKTAMPNSTERDKPHTAVLSKNRLRGGLKTLELIAPIGLRGENVIGTKYVSSAMQAITQPEKTSVTLNAIPKKSHHLSASAALTLIAGAASFAQGATVYESFDYTPDSAIVGANGGTGFDGAWTGVGTTTNTVVGAGLSFGNLAVAGGSGLRSARDGRGVVSRIISTTAQTGLLAESTIWFSVLMDPSGGNGFANNTYGTLIFGDTAFADASSSSAPALAGGNAFGVGFVGDEPTPSSTDASLVGIQGVAYTDGTLSTDNNIALGDVTSLIVGRIDFDDVGSGGNDVFRLYRVRDPNLALPASAFATITTDLDQSGFNIVSIADPQTSIFDEIRIGTSLEAVTIPEPGSLTLSGLGALMMFRRRRK